MDIIGLIAIVSIWMCLALGFPSFVRGLRKDGNWDIAPWWSMVAAAAVIWLIDWHYKEHGKTGKAQEILRSLANHVDNNEYREAVSKLKDAAFDREEWDTSY